MSSIEVLTRASLNNSISRYLGWRDWRNPKRGSSLTPLQNPSPRRFDGGYHHSFLEPCALNPLIYVELWIDQASSSCALTPCRPKCYRYKGERSRPTRLDENPTSVQVPWSLTATPSMAQGNRRSQASSNGRPSIAPKNGRSVSHSPRLSGLNHDIAGDPRTTGDEVGFESRIQIIR